MLPIIFSQIMPPDEFDAGIGDAVAGWQSSGKAAAISAASRRSVNASSNCDIKTHTLFCYSFPKRTKNSMNII
jgi:hypothetical protein